VLLYYYTLLLQFKVQCSIKEEEEEEEGKKKSEVNNKKKTI
jgi:hypothetical protein